jgi:hypothetical protein
METKVLDKQTSDKVAFMTYIVPAFADAYKINRHYINYNSL